MGRVYCCVVGCHNYSGKLVGGRTVSLHRFPADQKLSRMWRFRVRRRNWRPTTGSKLCSEHFVGRSGPSRDEPLPSVFPHKVFALSRVNGVKVRNKLVVADQPEFETLDDVNKENLNPMPMDSDMEEEKFDTTGMSEIDISVHMHDYLGRYDSSFLSRQRDTECQTKPTTVDIGVQVDTIGVQLGVTFATQTPRQEVKDFSVQVNLPSVTFDDMKDDDEVSFYTGLPTLGVFQVLFNSIKSAKDSVKKKVGRPRKMRLVDEFFMVLMRFRLGLLLEDLGERFCICKTSCSNIINHWIDFMVVFYSPLLKWPSRDTVRQRMPFMFKRKYPNCRIIIDCTELYTQTPQSLVNRSLVYSEYKSHMTWKLLLGISPSGVITFVSNLWAGSISDKMITRKSGLLDLLEPGDAVMADKGFCIADLLTPKGVHLIIPPFRKSGLSMSKRLVLQTRRVSNLRIHVERAMERVKNFRIIQGTMPITLARQASKIFKIICMLSNLQVPLIKAN